MIVEPHPLLDVGAFESEFDQPLDRTPTPDWLAELLRPDGQAPLSADDAVRRCVRDLLRHGGYKPAGRGKPASEYLIRAAGEHGLDSINSAVDACNAVSLHSGLPISIVDLDLAEPPLLIAVCAPGQSYVFNASGQTIRLDGLLCLHDAHGPCANAVRDSQRTKTHPGTQRTLSVVWGSRELVGRTARAVEWYRQIVERLGARTVPVVIESP